MEPQLLKNCQIFYQSEIHALGIQDLVQKRIPSFNKVDLIGSGGVNGGILSANIVLLQITNEPWLLKRIKAISKRIKKTNKSIRIILYKLEYDQSIIRFLDTVEFDALFMIGDTQEEITRILELPPLEPNHQKVFSEQIIKRQALL